MNVCKVTSVQLRRYFLLALLVVMIWFVLMLTQFFVPYGFHVMVIMGLVFSSKLGEFIKESVWQ